MRDLAVENAEKWIFDWKQCGQLIAAIAAWFWFIVAGCGGLWLLFTTGPWPPTHGWFALFSGLAAWPITAWASKKYLSVAFPGRVRLGAAALIIFAGRLTVDFIWPWPGRPPNRPDWVAILSAMILLTLVLTAALAHRKKPA